MPSYQTIADIMWYSGHVLTGLSIVFTHNNYPLACACVFIGQGITIFSRPIGRIKEIEDTNDNKSRVFPEEKNSV